MRSTSSGNNLYQLTFFRIRPVFTGRFSIRHNSENTSKMELYIEGIFINL